MSQNRNPEPRPLQAGPVVDRVRPDLLRQADATVAGILLNQVRQHPTQRNTALTTPRGMRQAERAGCALAPRRAGARYEPLGDIACPWPTASTGAPAGACSLPAADEVGDRPKAGRGSRRRLGADAEVQPGEGLRVYDQRDKSASGRFRPGRPGAGIADKLTADGHEVDRDAVGAWDERPGVAEVSAFVCVVKTAVTHTGCGSPLTRAERRQSQGRSRQLPALNHRARGVHALPRGSAGR